ncbi:TELO2-interacting protein 1 homolog isoform X2 [Thrips palmi]|nr:TELO2-interacting protein 1 homolog isoform X2 [Thrips palmi]
MLMMEIFDKNSPNMIKNVPEEMKLSVMNCAFGAIKNMSNDLQEAFYVKDNVPDICQIAYTCLELAASERLRVLRVRAMEVVLVLQQVPLDGPDKRSPWERQEVADIFQFILPGACTKLMSIVCGDITQGSKVLSTAIFTVSTMIALVMEDYATSDENDTSKMMESLLQLSEESGSPDHTPDISQAQPTQKKDFKKEIESSKGRTLEVRKKMALNLMPHLTKIAEHCEHSDAKVCREVVRACTLILIRSPRSLKEGLGPLLDAVVTLSVHEDDKVRNESLSSIEQLNKFFSHQNGYDFLQLAEENFYMLLTRLPRLVQKDGGAYGASSVALLSGYVQLLRPSMRNVLSSSAHLQRLTLSLLHVLTLECSNISVGNEYSMRQLTAERCNNLNVPWMRLRFSSDFAVLSNVLQLCDIVAENSIRVFELLSSQLLDTLHSVTHFRKECILLLNILLLSACKVKNDNVYEFGTSLLESYLAPELWPAKENSKSVTTVSRIQEDIAMTCLLTEGIGACILAVGRDKAQTHLLRVLYPLLEQAGSANSCTSLAGRRALTRVAEACGFDSDLVALISNNMDYLSHCMSIRLRHLDKHMGVFDALSLVLQHSSPEIALGLYNIVLNVLQQSSDTSQSKNNEAHLRVFLTFAIGVNQWLKPSGNSSASPYLGYQNIKAEMSDGNANEDCNFPAITICETDRKWTAVERLKVYQQNLRTGVEDSENLDEVKRDATEELPEELQPHNLVEEMEDDIAMDVDSDKKEEIPELAKLLVLVLKRCLHFLPSQIVDHQFLSIKTLDVGLQALEPFTDTLLPLIHQTWAPLVGRFEANQSPLIIRTAFQLLQTMARTAKDFLLTRTIKEVFPQFCKFLRSSVSDSNLKDRASVYRFSQKYKTQLALLSGLGPLACHLTIRGKDFHGLLSVSLLYLSCCQPHPLQAAAVTLIQCLYSLDADAVWWSLVSWWTPPHLVPILKLHHSSQRHDCEENIRRLLGLPGTQTEDGREEDER